MKLFIVRHGETEFNKNGIVQGRVDSPLTKKGIEQAKKLAERLSKEKIDLVFCSPLGRAKQTLGYILKYHKGVEVVFTDALQERDYGIFDGKPESDYEKNIKEKGQSAHTYIPEDGESYSGIQERALLFMELAKARHKNNVLVVAHGRFNKIFITTLLGRPLSRTNEIKQGNCCLNIIEVSEKGNKALVINDVGFL